MYNANSFYSIINTANPKTTNCNYFFFWSSSHFNNFNASLFLATTESRFPMEAHLLLFLSNLAFFFISASTSFFNKFSAYPLLGSSGCFSVGLAWADFSQCLLQNLTSLHLVCALQHFLTAPGLSQCPQFLFSEDSILMSNPNYFFNFYFDETQQLIDLLQFDRFLIQLLFVILTRFDFTDFFHDYFL